MRGVFKYIDALMSLCLQGSDFFFGAYQKKAYTVHDTGDRCTNAGALPRKCPECGQRKYEQIEELIFPKEDTAEKEERQ